MNGRYLEVTFRRGRPFTAYLYLPRPAGAKVGRTVPAGHGLMVDYDQHGTPIGVEITAPSQVTVSALDEILRSLGLEATEPDELAPLHAA